MYCVGYTKLAILKDGSIGNISQGNDIAYMDCEISLIPDFLRDNLGEKDENFKRYYPVINNIKKIKGHIIKHD